MDAITSYQLMYSVLGSTVSMIVFVFMTFATKREIERLELDMQRQKSDIDKRLERIESKIDRIIERD